MNTKRNQLRAEQRRTVFDTGLLAVGAMSLALLTGCVSNSAENLSAGVNPNANAGAPTSLVRNGANPAKDGDPVATTAFATPPDQSDGKITDAVRVVPDPEAANARTTERPKAATGPSRTGQFPTFGKRPRAQTSQLTPEQVKKLREELRAAGAQADASATTASDDHASELARLKAEAAEQGKEKLKKIEQE
ncbi:MAG: hypothetical protein AAF468_13150 [Pseudomonadota bacterium]